MRSTESWRSEEESAFIYKVATPKQKTKRERSQNVVVIVVRVHTERSTLLLTPAHNSPVSEPYRRRPPEIFRLWYPRGSAATQEKLYVSLFLLLDNVKKHFCIIRRLTMKMLFFSDDD